MGFDAILGIAESLIGIPDHVEAIGRFTDTHRIPMGGGIITDSVYGLMFNFVQNAQTAGMLAAPLARKIFRGVHPGDLPIITPENELSINYKVIRKLGLTIDDGLLSEAKKIVH